MLASQSDIVITIITIRTRGREGHRLNGGGKIRGRDVDQICVKGSGHGGTENRGPNSTAKFPSVLPLKF